MPRSLDFARDDREELHHRHAEQSEAPSKGEMTKTRVGIRKYF